jgi:hypothetical protein
VAAEAAATVERAYVNSCTAFAGRLGKSRAAREDASRSTRTDAVRLLVDRIDVEAFRAFAQLDPG